MKRIRTGDTVKVIAGDNKNLTGKVLKVQNKLGRVIVEGIGTRERHYKKSYARPQAGKQDIQVGLPISNVALLERRADEKKKSVEKKPTEKKETK